MKILYALMSVALFTGWTESRDIEFTNKCGHDIWVSPLTNAQGPALSEGIAKIGDGGRFTYQIPNSGWWVQRLFQSYFFCSFLLLMLVTGAVVFGLNLDVIAMETIVKLDNPLIPADRTVANRQQTQKLNSFSHQLEIQIVCGMMSAWSMVTHWLLRSFQVFRKVHVWPPNVSCHLMLAQQASSTLEIYEWWEMAKWFSVCHHAKVSFGSFINIHN